MLVNRISVVPVKSKRGADEKTVLQTDMLGRVFFPGNFYYPLFAMELLMF